MTVNLPAGSSAEAEGKDVLKKSVCFPLAKSYFSFLLHVSVSSKVLYFLSEVTAMSISFNAKDQYKKNTILATLACTNAMTFYQRMPEVKWPLETNRY